MDAILCVEVYVEILQDGFERDPVTTPVAQNTVLGYIAIGKTSSASLMYHTAALHTFMDENLSQLLRRFWEIEEVPKTSVLSPEKIECEHPFKSTIEQGEDGRFIIRLPFSQQPVLEGSRNIALSCLERRFSKQPDLAKAYCDFMQMYLDLQHMEKVSYTHLKRSCYFVPHHAVFNKTKIRVVFNASQKTSNGY